LDGIEKEFKGLNAISVYKTKKPEVKVDNIIEVLRRRPVL